MRGLWPSWSTLYFLRGRPRFDSHNMIAYTPVGYCIHTPEWNGPQAELVFELETFRKDSNGFNHWATMTIRHLLVAL